MFNQKFNQKQIQFQLVQNGEVLSTDVPENIKEKVEDLFLGKYNFYPAMECDPSEIENHLDELEKGTELNYKPEFTIFVHTDTYEIDEEGEGLSEEQLDKLDALEVTDDPVSTTKALKALLDIEFKAVLPSGKLVNV